MTTQRLFPDLKAEEIEWRTVRKTKTGWLQVAPYITARAVYEHLDNCVGASNWTVEYTAIEDGFICQLGLRLDGEWIFRQDGASRSDIEPIKGGISDALKRAAHTFGLGRELYSYPKVMVQADTDYIPDWAKQRLQHLPASFSRGELEGRDVLWLKDNAR